MNHSQSGFLPVTAWLGHLSMSWKVALAGALAAPLFGSVIYSAVTDRPLSAAAAAVFGGLLLFSWYLLISLSRAFSRSFRELHEAHIRLESGDFSTRLVPLGADEGAHQAEQFNDTAREVGRIVARVRDAAVEMAHATIELKNNASLVADATSLQQESTTRIATAAEIMTAGIAEMAAQSRNAEQISHTVSELSAEGSRSIAQSSDEIISLAQVINDVSQLMDHLAQRSSEVGQATGMIREISDQTNLLALNAAIEAARAGEMGRGFAVVADEVRKLAQRARTSADEISHTVGAIQTEIQQAAAHMAAASGQARENVARAGGVTKVLGKIDAQAMAALDSVRHIAAGAEQQNVNSAEIARHVEQIADSTRQDSHAANETAEMASHLTYLAGGIRGSLLGFRG